MASYWDMLSAAGAPFGTLTPQEQAANPPNLLDKVVSGLGQTAANAAMAPGNAYNSTQASPVTTDQLIKPAADLAGMMTLGAGAMPAESNAVNMGMRTLPADNYLKPLSNYADSIYRETSPEAALAVLPHSNVSVGAGPGGAPRQFYADTPDLALGQGDNRGVRIQYDAAPFQGQINKKPGWEPAFQSGAAEYTAAPIPGSNIRDAVQSVSIDRAALQSAPQWVQSRYQTLLGKLRESGWTQTEKDNAIELAKKYGLVGLIGAGAAASSLPVPQAQAPIFY